MISVVFKYSQIKGKLTESYLNKCACYTMHTYTLPRIYSEIIRDRLYFIMDAKGVNSCRCTSSSPHQYNGMYNRSTPSYIEILQTLILPFPSTPFVSYVLSNAVEESLTVRKKYFFLLCLCSFKFRKKRGE